MKKKNKMRKKANATGLNADRPHDRKAMENLNDLVKALPGCSDATGALRWLCEEEVPSIVSRFKRAKRTLKAG